MNILITCKTGNMILEILVMIIKVIALTKSHVIIMIMMKNIVVKSVILYTVEEIVQHIVKNALIVKIIIILQLVVNWK